MDVMTQIADAINRYGMTIVLMTYFLFKDYKFNANITSVLSEIKQVLAIIKDRWVEPPKQ